MIKIGKFMTARPLHMAPEAYSIHSRSGDVLATVEWYPRWKEYVLAPEIGATFSIECLRDLVAFVENCNRAAKLTSR